MWCRVDLIGINVSEENVATIFREERTNDLGTTLAVTISFVILQGF
jgi:hypothetical protein